MAVPQPFDLFLVVDFEATCEGENTRIYPQEIIEFPAVLVDAATGVVVSEVRTYVRPRHHPRLTEFCVNLTGMSQGVAGAPCGLNVAPPLLTGIQQRQVDAGVELTQALAMHDAWLREAVGARSFAVVTWGDWDCKTMLEFECRFKGIAKPAYFNRWVDLRVHFEAKFVDARGQRRNLQEAVLEAGLPWEGRLHSGLDDARNAARLLAELMRLGVAISITGSLPGAP
ncbi:hypothetical protein EJB05_13006, partial [Eragrostis curvula]